MLFCTSLLAYVGAGEQPTLSPRKLTLFNTHANVPIQSVPFPSTILAVHMNRKRQERWVGSGLLRRMACKHFGEQ